MKAKSYVEFKIWPAIHFGPRWMLSVIRLLFHCKLYLQVRARVCVCVRACVRACVCVCVCVVLVLLYSYLRPFYSCSHLTEEESSSYFRVKSGMFGRSARFGQRSCLFHTSIIGIKIN